MPRPRHGASAEVKTFSMISLAAELPSGLTARLYKDATVGLPVLTCLAASRSPIMICSASKPATAQAMPCFSGKNRYGANPVITLT